MVSCLCGVLTRRKTLAAKKVPKGGDDVASLPGGGTAALTSSSTPSAEDNGQAQLSGESFAQLTPPVGDQQKQLPPPPGSASALGHPRRSNSCLDHHSRSSSATASKLRSSISMRVLGSGGLVVGRGGGRRKEKKYNDEDSIWKKRIILGEKCRVPDEDDPIFYDEDGNRVSTFHPRTQSGLLSISRTSSCINTNNNDNNQEDLSSK